MLLRAEALQQREKSRTSMTEHSTEIAAPRQLLDVGSGELLPATTTNAAAVLVAAREMKDKIQDVIRDAEAFLAEESRIQGTKTLRAGAYTLSLTGGSTTRYDPVTLREALQMAGCPEERIDACIVAKIEYTVNRSVLRQLVGANPDYAAAADLAKESIETPMRASVKPA
jgi:hypothetical protein